MSGLVGQAALALTRLGSKAVRLQPGSAQSYKEHMDHLVDCRGMRCPLPALVLARHVRMHGAGRYQLQADDPAAEIDVPQLCAEHGWKLESANQSGFVILVG